ncbi:hypothetical protein DQ04_00951080 [Trypanosoma grayi]|uniref:hypothetical protein n=1 Tax=Trypanosoma grayi TaxID=71804 RepID=UPI0004F4A0B4|nr:hypothetical protein DQ04_00951080 [Trypanosoma grayi]KEG13532.1 hypothetical protein DQ04_00951080 [Trypanosoma grayi]
MDRAFVSVCAEFSSSYRNWNAEFQLAWEMEDNTISQAESRMEALRRVEEEFVAEAVYTVRQIVTLDDDGPRELPKFLQCYRVDNIFFRVLPDSRSGRNYVASLRGVLQSRTRLMTVPLSCMLFYRGMPVLAQALVPMPRQPTRLYGADSTNDKEVEAEIVQISEALNIPLPDDIICNVYQGLDGRWYCTSTNITTIPISQSLPTGSALKRQEMLVFCAAVTSGPEDVLAVLRAPPVLDALTQLKDLSQEHAQAQLCDTLHFYGVNFCFLKDVLSTFVALRANDTGTVRALETCVAVEMMARAIKQEFYLRVQANRTAYDDATLQNDIARHIARCLDERQFKQCFVPVLKRKYNVSSKENNIIDLCNNTRLSKRHDIIARLSILVGARSHEPDAASGNRIAWLPRSHSSVVPLLSDPSTAAVLAAQYNVTKTTDGHMYAFCLPLQSKVASWENKFGNALQYARLVAKEVKARHGQSSLPHLYALRNLCELLFSSNSVELLTEGRKHLGNMLHGFRTKAGPLTMLRRYVESGCWLLGASAIIDLKEKALRHFESAAQLVPAYLRSDAGAWLYIRPFLGVLRCKQAMRPQVHVDISAIVADTKKLATLVTPAVYFVEYLWELGMELRLDKRYDAAARTLQRALRMCRKVPRSDLDIIALTQDLINVYRAWDPAKYAAYCDALLTAMPRSPSANVSRPSDSMGDSSA